MYANMRFSCKRQPVPGCW